MFLIFMAEERFILASLEDKESKDLAQVIASNTARKILDLLSKEDLSESEISNKLNIPITTIEYNIQQLLKAKLIETKEFKWSEKGKKIKYYKVSNKLIIIAPKSQSLFLDKIKTIIPVALIGLAISGIIYWYKPKEFVSMKSTEMLAASPMLEGSVQSQPAYALYFLLGTIITIGLYLMIDYIRSRK